MKETNSTSSTTTSPTIETVYGMPAYIDRAAAVGEVHSRPHLLIDAPRSLLQLAFMTEGDKEKDQIAMDELSHRLGIPETDHTARLHGLTWEQGDLHCEKHTEFSTYLWCAPLDMQSGEPIGKNPFKHGFIPPGPVISGVRVTLLPWSSETETKAEEFKVASLCYSIVEGGSAAILTDFHQDKDGLTNILILSRDLSPARAGALVQRLLEIETYRTLAVLSLPLTRSMTTELRRMEARLAAITDEMCTSMAQRRDSDILLSELTNLAAELEAGVAANLYRFGASSAYFDIVEERVAALSEESISGYHTWHEFLQRRIAPAMRTCHSVKERQAKLSDKLTRAISLLRSWIDVELERQNRDLLASMDNRAKLQLRLQQTVEGLSVAAVSYYVVGLLSYLLKGVPLIHDLIAPVTAVMVPVIMVGIWLKVRSIRRAHADTATQKST